MTNEERIARFMNIVDTAFSMNDEDRAAYLNSLPQNTKNCESLDGNEYVQLLEGLCLSLKERVRQEEAVKAQYINNIVTLLLTLDTNALDLIYKIALKIA